MSNVTANALAISKLLVKHKLASAISVDVYSYIYSGLISGMDYFGTSGPNELIHPTYDLMAENAYLAAIRDLPKLTESLDTFVSPNRVTVVRHGTSGSVDVTALPTYEPTISGLPNLAVNFSNAENSHWSRDGGVEYFHHIVPSFEFASTSGGIAVNFVSDIEWFRFRSIFSPAKPASASQDRNYSLYFEQPRLDLQDGVYAFPEVVTGSDSVLAKIIAESGFLRYPIVRQLGLHVKHMSMGITETPYVAGTRRFLILTANGVDGQVLCLSGYILGEGPDLVYYQLALEDESKAWDVYYTPLLKGLVTVSSDTPFPSGNMHQCGSVKVNRYFAFSWSVDYVDTIIGELNADSEVSEQMDGDTLVRFHTRSLMVSKVVGRVIKDSYRAYLATGYGVYTPKKPEEVELIMKKWANIAESVSYTYAPVTLDKSFSLKKTTAYREYGRRREKACKTNNFLELQYNQEYSMKTVENKLIALKNFSVLAIDSKEVGSIKIKQPSKIQAVTTVATITAVGSSQFSYTTTTGLVGTKALTETGVSEFLDDVMPATFAGEVELLENVIGASLTEFHEAAAGQDVTEVRLDLQGMFIPSYPDWSVMTDALSNDELTAFLCTQLTDYRQFETGLPKLIRQFTGDRMYPAILKQFVVTT